MQTDASFSAPRTDEAPRTTDLPSLGWDDAFAEHFQPHAERGLIPARVAVGHRSRYRLYSPLGELDGQVAGNVRHAAPGDVPVVGDWAAVQPIPNEQRGVIHAVLPRRSAFVRRAAGRAAEEQVLAANVDTVLLVSGLDGDFNPRRIERYLVLAWASGARPVVVLSKADLAPDLGSRLLQVAAIAPGVPVHAISALHDDGLASLAPYLGPGRTVALLGSSGAGKSTLINRLAGRDLQRTAAVRARGPRPRQPRAPYHHPPRADRAAGRRAGARHAGPARAPVVGGRRRPSRRLRRRRGPRPRLPLRGLRSRQRARLCHPPRPGRRPPTGRAARQLPRAPARAAPPRAAPR